MEKYTNSMITAAKAGGKIVQEYFGKSLDCVEKTSCFDFRTQADLESERVILAILTHDFPDWNIYAEEQGKTNRGSRYTFIIDPLDGTSNFAMGLPVFTVSIGLMEDEALIAGVIYIPLLDEMYVAEKGKGAYRDGMKLHLAPPTTIDRSTIALCFGHQVSKNQESTMINAVRQECPKRVLSDWCSTYDGCLLALGRVEGMINNRSELYDFAAAKVILREAGAIMTDFYGNAEASDINANFVASNDPILHEKLIQVIARILPEMV